MSEGGAKLAGEFYSELDLRRVNLETFPDHFLFRIVDNCVRVLVVRHHSRRPALGVDRR
jgi:hypothetical protein